MVGFAKGPVSGLCKGRGTQRGVVEESQDRGCLIPNDVAPSGGFMFSHQVFVLELEVPLS